MPSMRAMLFGSTTYVAVQRWAHVTALKCARHDVAVFMSWQEVAVTLPQRLGDAGTLGTHHLHSSPARYLV